MGCLLVPCGRGHGGWALLATRWVKGTKEVPRSRGLLATRWVEGTKEAPLSRGLRMGDNHQRVGTHRARMGCQDREDHQGMEVHWGRGSKMAVQQSLRHRHWEQSRP